MNSPTYPMPLSIGVAPKAVMNQTAKNFNQILPDGIKTSFKTVSIVELGFAGNVLREVYRIGLDDGMVLNVATGEQTQLARKQGFAGARRVRN